ncbi:hypothetical protein [Halogranum amylolyticum]|nr:hypothetical protein [Halogranum amylolyticum]
MTDLTTAAYTDSSVDPRLAADVHLCYILIDSLAKSPDRSHSRDPLDRLDEIETHLYDVATLLTQNGHDELAAETEHLRILVNELATDERQ